MPRKLIRCNIFLSILPALLMLFATSAHGQQPLRLGVHPYLAATEIQKRFSPLTEHLGKVLGRKIDIVVGGDYQEHIRNIATGTVDMAFMGPASYTIMTDRYGKRPILSGIEYKGARTFYGAIVVRKDSPYKKIGDLLDKKIGFVDKKSTMHLVPLYMLVKAGVSPKRMSQCDFLGKHENVALAVLAGEYDAGALKYETFERYQGRGLRLLAKTPPISEHVFVASTKLPEETVQTIRKTMYELKNSARGRAVMAPIKDHLTGMVPAEDSEFNEIRKMIKVLTKVGISDF